MHPDAKHSEKTKNHILHLPELHELHELLGDGQNVDSGDEYDPL